MARSAKETIEEFWRVQDAGDYRRLVDLFAEDALLVDPVYGSFRGREAIRGFMEKMNAVMAERNIDFVAEEIDGGGEVAWAQWVARTPRGNIEGCGLYRVRDGLLTYYRDYMNAEPEAAESRPD
jgi:ketosteroid isomerase-like protein